MDSLLREYLWKSQKVRPRILDLGCGEGENIFCTYKQYFRDTKKKFDYTGVDIIEKDFTGRLNNQGCTDLDFDDDFDITIDEYQENFHMHFKKDIRIFLNEISPKEEYEFIILSNVLHKLTPLDAEKVFDKCVNQLSFDGIIYTAVLGNNYPEKYPDNYLYTPERFEVLKSKVNVIWRNESKGFSLAFMGVRNG